MSERSLVRAVDWLVGDDANLKEAAGIVMKQVPWAALVWDKDIKFASSSLQCWENKDAVHSRSYSFERIDASNAAAATQQIRDEKRDISLVYRFINDGRLPESLTAVMYQIPGSSTKHWMPIWRDLGDAEMGVVDALLDSQLLLIDISHFREAAFNAVGRKPSVERIPKGRLKGGRGHILKELGSKMKLAMCEASSFRPIAIANGEDDFDAAYIWHMCHELELVHSANGQ